MFNAPSRFHWAKKDDLAKIKWKGGTDINEQKITEESSRNQLKISV